VSPTAPTYWKTLVNPSTLRNLRLETYFNFTFRFQPFILKKQSGLWDNPNIKKNIECVSLPPPDAKFVCLHNALTEFQHPTALFSFQLLLTLKPFV